MPDSLAALDDLILTLDKALMDDDWTGLTELDAHVHAHVEVAVGEAKAGEADAEAVRVRLDQLQTLYEQARERALQARDEAATALRRMGKTHQAASAYLDNAFAARDRDSH